MLVHSENMCQQKLGLVLARVNLSYPGHGNGHNFPKRVGGVGLYIRNTFNYSLNNLLMYNKSCNDIEMLWLELHLPHSKNILLGTIY